MPGQAQALSLRGLGPTGTTFLDFDTSVGLLKDNNARFFHPVPSLIWPLLVGSTSSFIWTCTEGIWRIDSVAEAHTVVGGAAAAVTVVVCPGSVALGSGVTQLTAVLDLTVTAPAKSFGTLIASPTRILRGDSVGVVLSGTLTGLVGSLTVNLRRIG